MSITLVCLHCQHSESIGPDGDEVFMALGPEISPGHFQVLEDHPLSAFEAAKIGFWALKYMNERIEELAAERDSLLDRLAQYESHSSNPVGHAARGPYVASSVRPHFHRPECIYAQPFLNTRRCEIFETHEEAVAAGKKPCKTCRA